MFQKQSLQEIIVIVIGKNSKKDPLVQLDLSDILDK
jgi:hypothetical protein